MRRSARGFTLVETLVAIAIAAVGLLAIFELFPAGFAASAKSQSRVTATNIASDILNAYRRVLNEGAGNGSFGNLCKFTHTYTESLGLKYSNDYTIFGGVTGDPTYYYKIWIDEVVDPLQKYQSAIDLTRSRGRLLDGNYASPDCVGLRRVTVFVRGPFASNSASGGANDPNWTPAGFAKGGAPATNGQLKITATGAVEIKMVCYINNTRMGYTTLAFPAGPGQAPYGNRLYVNDASGFTIFNYGKLTTQEQDDTGPESHLQYSTMYNGGVGNTTISTYTFPRGASTAPVGKVGAAPTGDYGWGLNELKLDNVWIGSTDTSTTPRGYLFFNWLGDPTGGNTNAFGGEGNKIINIERDTSGGPRNGYYYLELLHALRGQTSAVPPYTPADYPAGTAVYGICGLQSTP